MEFIYNGNFNLRRRETVRLLLLCFFFFLIFILFIKKKKKERERQSAGDPIFPPRLRTHAGALCALYTRKLFNFTLVELPLKSTSQTALSRPRHPRVPRIYLIYLYIFLFPFWGRKGTEAPRDRVHPLPYRSRIGKKRVRPIVNRRCVYSSPLSNRCLPNPAKIPFVCRGETRWGSRSRYTPRLGAASLTH